MRGSTGGDGDGGAGQRQDFPLGERGRCRLARSLRPPGSVLLSFDSNIYEPLVRRDRNLRLEPALATHWSQPASNVWRFTLRHGVTFQDGTPFSAEDVLFSYDRAIAAGSRIPAPSRP